jgi:methyl-accepting chemotaxis protein
MNKLSLKARLTLTINGVILLALTVLISLEVRQSYGSAREQAFKGGEETTFHYANQVDHTLNNALLTAKTMAQTLEGMKLAWVDDRSLYNSLISQVLRGNTNFLAVWSVWEPDALDGKDANFVNKSGHDATGRFIPCWTHAQNDVELNKMTGYNQPGSGDFYLVARNSGQETMLEPRHVKYAGTEATVITVAAPIFYNGSVAGVVGIDIPLENVQKLIESIRPYETGSASLISGSGRFLADLDHNKIGASLDDSSASQQIKAAILGGNSFKDIVPASSARTEVYRVMEPVRVGTTTARWSLAVNLPMDKILSEARAAMYRSVSLGVLILVIMVAVVGWLSRSIARPLTHIAESLGITAGGAKNSSSQMKSASQNLAEGASEQAASIEETSSSLEEIASMTRRNSESTRQASDLTKQARDAAERGAHDMEAMANAMTGIKVSSDDIAKIIKTIDEIAFQTNILALNAAVEAARAGEAGLGFAVVADEVRNLAQRSAQAAKETSTKIEGAILKTSQGVELSGKVAERLNEIVAKVRQVDELVTEVAVASREQTEGITQINAAIGQMDTVTQTNAASAEESAAVAEELNRQAETMEASVTELQRLVQGAGKVFKTQPAAMTSIPAAGKSQHNNGPRLKKPRAARSSVPLQ